MKVVIVGASGHSTPALFDLPVPLDESTFSFVLVARNVERLAAVARAIDLLTEARGYRVRHRCISMENLEHDLIGADVIIIQIRVGGYASRDWDERFPLRYGLCGDEGLGAGGLAAAWRTWPELYALLTRISSIQPGALVLLLTSPVGILTRCALSSFPMLRLFGICELPWTTLVELCGDDVKARTARFSYVGINHLGWFSDVRCGGRVLLGPNDVLPLKYVALADARESAVRAQMLRPSRARQLDELACAAFQTYTHGSATDIASAVRRRATPWYAHSILPFLAGLAGLAGTESGPTFFLTQKNESYCDWLDEGDVVEMPFTLTSTRMRAGILGAWQRSDVAMHLRSLVRYESVAADAVRTHDLTGLGAALRTHPWLSGTRVTPELVRDVVATPDAYAPQAPATAALR